MILNYESYRNILEIIQFLSQKGIDVNSFLPLKIKVSKTIALPSSVKEIKSNAFNHCSSLNSIILSKSQSTNDIHFSFDKKSKDITIPSAVNLVEKIDFSGLIPNEKIQNDEIRSCSCKIYSSIKPIEIPTSEKNNKKLSYFYISKIVQEDTFSNEINQKVIPFYAETMLDYFSLIGKNISLNKIAIPSYTLTNKTCFLGDYFYTESITDLEISKSLDSIGNRSFCNCSYLSNVTIPSSVICIGKYAFDCCDSLVQINFEHPSNLKVFENGIFQKCESLTRISIPTSVTVIKSYAFNGCSSLKEIILPSSITKIGDDAFCECSSLTKMIIPSSVESIGNCAFYKCKELTQVTINGPLKLIENSLFNGCLKLESIEIPNTVTSIGYSSFKNCQFLTKIILPSQVYSIGDSAFYNCSSLSEISIPQGLISIGNSSFRRCSSLKKIYIPYSLKSIGKYVFKYCSSLEEIKIPYGLYIKLKINLIKVNKNLY